MSEYQRQEIDRLLCDIASITDCVNVALREAHAEEVARPDRDDIRLGINRLAYAMTAMQLRKDAEIARLGKAIVRWVRADRAWTMTGGHYDPVVQDELDAATMKLHAIANEVEGR